jgi:hypothetical protein
VIFRILVGQLSYLPRKVSAQIFSLMDFRNYWLTEMGIHRPKDYESRSAISQGAAGGSPVTPGVYFAVGVTARVDDRVGRGVGELAGNGGDVGLGVFVGGGTAVFVGNFVAVAGGGGCVGIAVLVAILPAVADGS